jgi:hypothetical protein
VDLFKYKWQSDIAKKYVAHGRADVIFKQLTLKFGKLSEADRKRVLHGSLERLDLWATRVLTATTLGQVWRARRKKR